LKATEVYFGCVRDMTLLCTNSYEGHMGGTEQWELEGHVLIFCVFLFNKSEQNYFFLETLALSLAIWSRSSMIESLMPLALGMEMRGFSP